jgi:hypothetical protein
MTFARVLVVAVALAVPGPMLAQPAGPGGACRNDIRIFCAGVPRGGGRIRECMKQHRAELSAACKVELADRMLARPSRRGPNGPAAVQPLPPPPPQGGGATPAPTSPATPPAR